MQEIYTTDESSLLFTEIDNLNNKAWDLRRTDVQKAFALAEKAHLLAKKENYTKGIADSLKSLGYCYWQFTDYTKALESSMEARTLYQYLNDKGGEADTVSTIGAVYAFTGENEKRLEFNLNCLQLRKETGDTEGEIITLNNIGDTYMKLGKPEKALEKFYESLNIPRKNDSNIAIIYLNIGELFLQQNKLTESENYLNKCITISEEYELKRILLGGMLLKGELELKKENFDLAISVLDNALKLATTLESKEYIFEINELLSRVFENKGDIVKAFEHFKNFHKTKELVFKENNTQQIKNLQFQHQIDAIQKSAEIEQLKNIELKKALTEIKHQRNQISRTNKNITDSIVYAKRIQEAILPSKRLINQLLPNSFILYIPKDIVSGDFYWVESAFENVTMNQFEDKRNHLQKNNLTNQIVLFAAADCTGHGVPGAFMSIVGHNLLNQAVKVHNKVIPADILNEINLRLSETLQQTLEESTVRDGMDIALCSYDSNSKSLQFAGANNPLWIVRNKEIIEIKGDKFPIGFFVGEQLQQFKNNIVQLQEGDCIYIFTDGYADQFGGTLILTEHPFGLGKKFKYKQLKELILAIHKHPMQEQQKLLEDSFLQWKGDLEQVDDICIIGLRVV